MVQSNIEQAAKLSPDMKLHRIKGRALNLKKKTEEVHTKRDEIITSKSVDARLQQKKAESMQILAQARHQKEQFKKVYGGLLRKIAVMIVFYQFIDKLRDMLYYGRLSLFSRAQ
jgi:hypothetical protein